jgi:hypothetical protein
MRGRRAFVAVLLAVTLSGGMCWAGFSGTDVFLPSVGRAQGIANWYTAVWVHNPGATPALAQFTFLERNVINTGASPVTYTVQPGDTVRFANAMTELFGRDGFGAIRVQSSAKLVVTSRIFSRGATETDRDSKGQDFGGVPASFAIGAGQTTQLLGVYQTQPSGSSELRYNFGFVETVGESCTVVVTPRDTTGAAMATAKSYTVRALEQRQFQFKDEFPALSTDNARLEVAVASGAGRVIAFGSGITNGSQDPTTFEMAFDDALLAENSSGSGSIGGVTAGAGLTGGGTTGTVTLNVGAGEGITVGGDTVGIAAGGVTKGKLAATGGTSGQVLGTDGTGLVWRDPAAGTGTGDISAVTAGAGLSGGGTTGDVTLSVAAGGITTTMLATGAADEARIRDSAVTSAKIADGAVGNVDLGANAVTSAKIADETIGTADIAGKAVTQTKLGATGSSTAGKVLGTDGSNLIWTTAAGLTLPYSDGSNVAADLFAVAHTATSGTKAAIFGTASSGTGYGVRGENSASSGGGAGVAGSSRSTTGQGVWGQNTATSGATAGVEGDSSSPTGAGVRGVTLASSSGIGVLGEANGIGGTGVRGFSYATSGASFGVSGENRSASGAGVKGVFSGTGNGTAGYFTSAGRGVYAEAAGSGGSNSAVYAVNTNSNGIALWATSSSSDSTIVGVNKGSGDLLRLFSEPTGGNIRLKVTNIGNVLVDGAFFTGGVDIAEAFAVEGDVRDYEPGDVLVIARGAEIRVEKCAEAASPRVAGVVATKPGIVLSRRGSEEDLSTAVPLGVIGVIPTKVTAENGPIAAGDLLVTAATPGHAAKAVPVVIQGVAIYPAGALIGKALEAFEGPGSGLIEVLVNVK